jgi:hypothetical protein
LLFWTFEADLLEVGFPFTGFTEEDLSPFVQYEDFVENLGDMSDIRMG